MINVQLNDSTLKLCECARHRYFQEICLAPNNDILFSAPDEAFRALAYMEGKPRTYVGGLGPGAKTMADEQEEG